MSNTKVPNHLAIIMDGNGRWAENKGHQRFFGHVRGAKNVKEITIAAQEMGINFLTLFAFSTENWRRPQTEVGVLMNLLVKFLQKERFELHKNHVRFKVIGELSKLPVNAQEELNKTIDLTRDNNGITMVLALNYGGRQDIINATRILAAKAANGELKADEIEDLDINKYLQTNFLPDPDLLIRTSGEFRLSNFLLWQSAYTELYVCEKHWPDFKREDLKIAIESFGSRDRRFGEVKKSKLVRLVTGQSFSRNNLV